MTEPQEAVVSGSAPSGQALSDAILRTAVEGILTVDETGVIRSANPAATRIFQYDEAELVGADVCILMPEPHSGAHGGYIERYVRGGEARVIGRTVEVEGKRKDRSIFPLRLSVGELRENGERLFVGILGDITERRRVEAVRDEFISTVSHELRTPLTSVIGALGLVRSGVVGALSDEASELLAVASRNAECLVRLIDEILDIDRLSSGGMPLRLQTLNMAELVGEALRSSQVYAADQAAELRLVEPTPDGWVLGDRDRLVQVLANLLSNAVKYGEPRSGVEVCVQRRDPWIRVCVTDRGPGIPEPFRQQVFEKFTRADATDAREKGGTGLGLAITRAIVRRHGGHIDFETSEGRGTTFFFDLPLAEAPGREGLGGG